jgi:tRNA threonylcarbamoyladenosine biosynthesis protein TsaB
MRILALETSTEYCSAALYANSQIWEKGLLVGNMHSELLLPMVQELLAEGGLALSQLDGIAFGAGPGSFTGLRIACSCAQGLAFGADLPVVPVSTLEALAHGTGAGRVATCLDARMQEVYFAAYCRSGDRLEATHQPGLCRPEAVPALLTEGWLGCGSGFAAYREALDRRLGAALRDILPEVYPKAASVALLALPILADGGGVSAWKAAPVYLRDKVALKVCER